MTQIETADGRKRDSLNQAATGRLRKVLKNMTKVISPSPPMKGVDAKRPFESFRSPEVGRQERAGQGQSIQEGVESHGPRCIEQSFSDLRREQPEQHEQQLADGSAAVVVGVEDQLRSGRRRGPFAGERAGGQLSGPDAVGDQRDGRRGSAAGGRRRAVAGDEPAEPRHYAGDRSLERHAELDAGRCGEPGVPVDPGRSQQHRIDDDLQPAAGV